MRKLKGGQSPEFSELESSIDPANNSPASTPMTKVNVEKPIALARAGALSLRTSHYSSGQTSVRIMSSYTSRRRISLASPFATSTIAGRSERL